MIVGGYMKKDVILIYLLLAVLFMFLREPFYEFILGTDGQGLLDAIESSILNDTLAFVLIVLGIPGMIRLSDNLSETGRKWTRMLSGCLLYMYLVMRFFYGDTFTTFASLPDICYSDILLILLPALWISTYFTGESPEKQPVDSLHQEDNLLFDDNHETDFMGRDGFVKDLFDRLVNEKGNENGATGVAITGGWGTGKSWLMTNLMERLIKSGHLCINFQPWLYGDADITRQFYLTLERELKSEGIRMTELKAAVCEIDNDGTVGLGRAILSLFGILFNLSGREKTVKDIKNRLQTFDRQIFVFVDDCDRLAHDEMLQVLSLVRNTGDFPHITYVMAFSKEMVDKTIEKEEGLQYVSKMFNLTKELPPITDGVISDYLNQVVEKMFDVKGEFANPYINIPITHYLPTVREAKKYLNQLWSDYKSLQERFNKYFINRNDFCLIELLKYKYSELYFGLRTTPTDYIRFVNTGWNSPGGLPIGDANDDSDQLKLMKALFREGKSPRDQYEMIGIANKEFFELYFEGELSHQYLEAEEFNQSVEEGNLPTKVGEWVASGYVGVIGLLSAIHFKIARRDLFEAMISYVWYRCEQMNAISSLDNLTYGYDKEAKHSYSNIRKVIAEVPQFELMTFQRLSAFDDPTEVKDSDSMEALIEQSDRTLELMGVWMNMLRSVNNTDYPYDEVRYYIEMIWKKVTGGLTRSKQDTLDVIDILGDCTLEDTFDELVLKLVKDNPQRWLGATILKLKDGDKEYYMLKSRAIHALFGSYDKVVKELDKIEAFIKIEHKDYVHDYINLVNRLAAMTINRDDASIDNKYKKSACIECSELKTLERSVFIGMKLVRPIATAIMQIHKTPFWQGESLRIHREEQGAYMGSYI